MIPMFRGGRGTRPWIILLLAASALVLASCGGCFGDEVSDLSVSGNTVHAALNDWEQYVSTDAGQSWTETDAEPPATAMRPDCGADGTCFRIVDLTVERMESSGAWEAVWSIPIERKEYVTQKACRAFPVEGSGGYDMYFSTGPVAVDTPHGSVAVIGMGNQGVVVVDDSNVSRVGVGWWATPNDFTGAFTGYEAEGIIVLVLSLPVFVVLLVVHGSIRQPRSGPRPSSFGAIFLSVGIWVVAVLLPFELWARGVLDYYDDAIWASRIAGIATLLVLAFAQPALARKISNQPNPSEG